MTIFNTKRPTFKYEILAVSVLLAISWIYFYQVPYVSDMIPNSGVFLILASILWIYMAMNIWANDVANNMWPAVWSKALTLTMAIVIAAIFEASWAIIAWWDVVDTIKWWIIDSSGLDNPQVLLVIMMSTLLWAALWINIATFSRAPVSATHSILWALVWAWIAASWTWVVHWSKIWEIVASWVISPLMWWAIAIAIMLSIRHTILKQDDMWEAAKRRVPVFVWIMAWVFMTYLILKWLKNVERFSDITPSRSLFFGILFWVSVYVSLSFYYKKMSAFFKNSKKFINRLFNIPLIFAVSLLSFAHWANDVANAIWPLAAINDIIMSWNMTTKELSVPFWVMFLGWLWIAFWLMIFGWRLIKTVWSEITKLNQIRAYSVALSAAITVLIASHLWLPVSSTHIALGWIFWVWLMREFIKRSHWKDKDYIDKWAIKSIFAAWVITLPVSAWISALMYYLVMYVS